MVFVLLGLRIPLSNFDGWPSWWDLNNGVCQVKKWVLIVVKAKTSCSYWEYVSQQSWRDAFSTNWDVRTSISLTNGYAIILQQNKIIHPKLHITFVHWVCMVKVHLDLKKFSKYSLKIFAFFIFLCWRDGKKKVKNFKLVKRKGVV